MITVHKRFTNHESDTSSDPVKMLQDLAQPELSNGLKTVHNRFTNHDSDTSSEPVEKLYDLAQPELSNGLQTVHKRFTSHESHLSFDPVEQVHGLVQPEFTNGSHTFQNRFLDISSSEPNKNKDLSLPVIKFSQLIGNQRDIILALYKNIQLNDLVTTKELTLNEISMLSGVNKKSLKNTLFRLASAGLIIRSDQKVGRGGWVKYSIHSDIRDEIKNIGIFLMVKKK